MGDQQRYLLRKRFEVQSTAQLFDKMKIVALGRARTLLQPMPSEI